MPVSIIDSVNIALQSQEWMTCMFVCGKDRERERESAGELGRESMCCRDCDSGSFVLP